MRKSAGTFRTSAGGPCNSTRRPRSGATVEKTPHGGKVVAVPTGARAANHRRTGTQRNPLRRPPSPRYSGGILEERLPIVFDRRPES